MKPSRFFVLKMRWIKTDDKDCGMISPSTVRAVSAHVYQRIRFPGALPQAFVVSALGASMQKFLRSWRDDFRDRFDEEIAPSALKSPWALFPGALPQAITVCAVGAQELLRTYRIHNVVFHGVSLGGDSLSPARRSGRMCGNKITSLIDCFPVTSITKRSMPMPIPAAGGMPYDSARM